MPNTKKILKIAGIAIAFRITVYFLSFCIMILFGDYKEGFGLAEFLEGWIRWDATNYINIAGSGYAGVTENGQYLMLVFFPLYPFLMKISSVVLPNLALCGILISTMAYGGGCCYLYLWMEEEHTSDAARNALILISIFPFAFFFGGIMTESLFFFVSMGALYYLKKQKWFLGSIFICLSGLTRLQGALLILPALAEIYTAYKPIKAKRLREIIAGASMVSIGTLVSIWIYLGINARVSGNPFQFSIYQKEHWSQGFGFLPQTIKYIWENAVATRFQSISMALWIPELLLFGLGITALVYGIKRQRISVSIYFAGYLICVYSATWLLSAGRYMACAVPLFMIGGEWLAAHPKCKLPVQWLSISLMTIYMIAYYLWKQVM